MQFLIGSVTRSRRFEAQPPAGHQQVRSYRNWNPPLLGNLPDDFLRILPQQSNSTKVKKCWHFLFLIVSVEVMRNIGKTKLLLKELKQIWTKVFD